MFWPRLKMAVGLASWMVNSKLYDGGCDAAKTKQFYRIPERTVFAINIVVGPSRMLPFHMEVLLGWFVG